MRRRSAVSWMRRIFSTVRAPHDPAFTVESFAMIATGRPWIRPMPVTTPSAGSSPASAFTSRPSSANGAPGSSSFSRRSRQKSFFCSASLGRARALPDRAASTRARRSSVSPMEWARSYAKEPDPFSLSAIDRLALLAERVQRLHAILRRQDRLVALELHAQALGQRPLAALVDGSLRRAHGERPVRRDLRRHRGHALGERGRGHDLVHEPDARGLLGADASTREDQLLRARAADQPRQALSAAGARDDRERHFREPELRVRRRDAQVAREQQLGAAAERDAVHGRDRRHRERLHLVHQRADRLDEARHLLERHRRALLEIGARAERLLAGAGDHDGAHGALLREGGDVRAHLRERVEREAVRDVGPVDRQPRDRALSFEARERLLARGAQLSSSISASPSFTKSPGFARIDFTLPARSLWIWRCIFIDSITATSCPSVTASPGFTSSSSSVPAMFDFTT